MVLLLRMCRYRCPRLWARRNLVNTFLMVLVFCSWRVKYEMYDLKFMFSHCWVSGLMA